MIKNKYLNIILFISITMFVTPSCKKSVLANADSYIRGRVIIKNESGQEILSVDRSKLELKLSVDNDKTTFLYSTFADKDGYFIFQLPANDLKDEYYVFCEFQNSETVFFTGEKKFIADGGVFTQDVIELTPDYSKQNYFSLTVKDSLLQNVGNCNLFFLYQSTNCKQFFYGKPYLYRGNRWHWRI